MIKFKSFLAPQLQQYVIYRHKLGYAMKASLSHLKTFDRYLKQKQAQEISLPASFFMQMQADLKIEPRSVNPASFHPCVSSLTIWCVQAHMTKTR